MPKGGKHRTSLPRKFTLGGEPKEAIIETRSEEDFSQDERDQPSPAFGDKEQGRFTTQEQLRRETETISSRDDDLLFTESSGKQAKSMKS